MILEVLGIIAIILIVLGALLTFFLDILEEIVDKRRKNGGGLLWNILYYILGIINLLRFWD